MIVEIPVGSTIEGVIEWMNTTLAPLFDAVSFVVGSAIRIFENLMLAPPSYLMLLYLAALAWRLAGWKLNFRSWKKFSTY